MHPNNNYVILMDDDKNFIDNCEGIPELNPSDYPIKPTKYLSEQVREVFGREFPNIDLFQTTRSIIEIPTRIISEIIHKGNNMRLTDSVISKENIVVAFKQSLMNTDWDISEIIDCVVGIFLDNDSKFRLTEIEMLEAYFKTLPRHIDPFWGIYIDNNLPPESTRVITIATNRAEFLSNS